MTVSTFETALHCRLNVPKRKNQRGGQCACVLGTDIGAYDTCGHLCRYCYANTDENQVCCNLRAHDPASPLLLGKLMPGDKIHEARQESWRVNQLSMEL